MRFSPESDWDANKGLKGSREFLEKIKKKHSGISTADLWTLAGGLLFSYHPATLLTRPVLCTATAIEAMGGPNIAWRPGRSDTAQNAKKSLPDGRLPNANMGCAAATNSHIRDIFGRMGLTDKEIVALLGAHALGRCHPEASG
jgi:cytochrome c peroxidase